MDRESSWKCNPHPPHSFLPWSSSLCVGRVERGRMSFPTGPPSGPPCLEWDPHPTLVPTGQTISTRSTCDPALPSWAPRAPRDSDLRRQSRRPRSVQSEPLERTQRVSSSGQVETKGVCASESCTTCLRDSGCARCRCASGLVPGPGEGSE